MSIASEISRLQGAKADIKTAIEGKGVTVPSATKLDGYADLVDAIPQGSTPTGTKQISVTQNGTQTENVSGYASAQLNVAVPNSYSAGDEGKVVSNGALVAQTAHADVTPSTSDQTIDTTLNNSLKVKGDANLVAGNIKKDVEIFGTTGSYEGGGGGADYLAELCNGTLTELNDDNITSLASPQMLRGNTTVTKVFLKNCEEISASYTLAGKSIQTVVLPSLTTITSGGGYSFSDNPTALKVDIGSLSNIPGGGLAGASAMNILVLRKSDSITTLTHINGFNNTPFASGKAGGTLYVPQALMSSYQGATNWSTILGYATNQIKSIESTHTDPTAPIDLTLYYVDGTPIAA